MKNQYHFLIVIIVVEMIFTIQLKKEWNKRLNFGTGNMIDSDFVRWTIGFKGNK